MSEAGGEKDHAAAAVKVEHIITSSTNPKKNKTCAFPLLRLNLCYGVERVHFMHTVFPNLALASIK